MDDLFQDAGQSWEGSDAASVARARGRQTPGRGFDNMQEKQAEERRCFW